MLKYVMNIIFLLDVIYLIFVIWIKRENFIIRDLKSYNVYFKLICLWNICFMVIIDRDFGMLDNLFLVFDINFLVFYFK